MLASSPSAEAAGWAAETYTQPLLLPNLSLIPTTGPTSLNAGEGRNIRYRAVRVCPGLAYLAYLTTGRAQSTQRSCSGHQYV